jgi:asparagine synthase (glutamine-hydrolysing)
MCGIVGLWDGSIAESTRQSCVQSLADRLVHRGPDGGGTWLPPSGAHVPLALAHRRLAIRGAGAQGAQPMSHPGGAGTLVYNGELFGVEPLREELVRAGVQLRGSSDTELLLHALARWGVPETLERVRGQFAFAWYESKSRKLFLGRDRLGIRPLYYALRADRKQLLGRAQPSGREDHGVRFAFASEQKALLPLPWVDRSFRHEALVRFLITSRTDDVPGQTLLSHVHSIPPGHWAVFDGRALTMERYYRANAAPQSHSARDVRTELERAVEEQLVSDFPVGAMVSGGLDSSAVVMLADQVRCKVGATEPLHLFAYRDERVRPEADESSFQQAIFDAVRSPHVVHWVSSNESKFEADFVDYFDHQEEPYGDVSSYAEYCIAREARAHDVKVLLNGLGGDEVFAGYGGFFGPIMADALLSGDLDLVRRFWEVAPQVAGSHKQTWRTSRPMTVASALMPMRLRATITAARVTHHAGFGLWDTAMAAHDIWHHGHAYDGAGVAQAGARTTNAALRAYIESLCVPRFLSHSDRVCLAHSVEGRVPLLDERLIEVAWATPVGERLSSAGLKGVLRSACADILPPVVRDRAWKLGFHAPLDVYVAAVAPRLESGSRTLAAEFGTTREWSKLGTHDQWQWGALGCYMDWVRAQPVLEA